MCIESFRSWGRRKRGGSKKKLKICDPYAFLMMPPAPRFEFEAEPSILSLCAVSFKPVVKREGEEVWGKWKMIPEVGMPGEVQNLDFSMLSCKPEAFEKVSRASLMEAQLEIEALVKSRISSAKKRWEKRVSECLNLNGIQRESATLLRMSFRFVHGVKHFVGCDKKIRSMLTLHEGSLRGRDEVTEQGFDSVS
ncbi:uncharacterized protein G2W53_038977 [Senna tora]|uniref:Uncharacterized protein n=1 Tax=Senna tora TaxID=362788 RepID=A0A834SP88_9FABA|nr:uncharacterized protein G2W53_038977 [Senna tora]